MLADVERLFLDNLISKESVWSHLGGVATGCISLSLFVEGLSSSTLACFLFLNYEISLSVTSNAPIFVDQWEFTDISEHFLAAFLFSLPFSNVVTSFFLLQPLKNHLIFMSNLCQLSLSCTSIQTTFSTWSCEWLESTFMGLIHDTTLTHWIHGR
jgi:hypothetical protein